MHYFTGPLLEIPEYKEILKSLAQYKTPIHIGGPADSQKAHISYALCKEVNAKGVFVAYNEMQARKAFEDFSLFYGEDVLFFPSREIMLHDIEAKSNEAAYQRLVQLEKLIEGNYRFVVTSTEALAQKLISAEFFKKNMLSLQLADTLEISELSRRLTWMGYERVAVVEGKGQFSVRGGIIDIFAVNEENAIRIELFGDEIDSIRTFNVLSQRSIDKVEKIRIIPGRETIYEAEKLESIIASIEGDLREHLKKISGSDSEELKKNISLRTLGDIDRLRNEHYFPGLDRYVPYLIEKPATLLDYTGEALVFTDEPGRFYQRLENILLEHYESCKGLLEKGQVLPRTTEAFFQAADIERARENKKQIHFSTFLTEAAMVKTERIFHLPTKSMGSYQGNLNVLIEDIRQWKLKKSKIIVFAGPKGRGERFRETLLTHDMDSVYLEDPDSEILPGQVVITHGSLHKGFEYPSIGLVIISGKEVFGQERKIKKGSQKKEGQRLKAFTDLNMGDYVVHQAHGIGQYVGIDKLVVDGIKKDYLKIKYLEGGFLYIPSSQLDLIQKFIGSDGKTPKLNKLGGTEWAKTKKRVKESLRELAEELVKLYAQRQAQKGFAFSKDTVWQKQMEDLFPYQETDDQLKCIHDIKLDMESERPMDRLLCGDVGYGKTEVAMRAVFKSVMDGKQVAYLVPTTILAQQQYNSFRERMKEFPVTVDVISRFRSPSEQKKILRDVKSGKTDVLIGTHRLLQKDIQFKDLGLLVVDEEQRFGVTHKEKLKNMKTNVDVLTLTATPIPRTLHMSLVGIRDISVIEDPPEERYPVQTYVMEYNHDVIRDAITREMSRNGQVFYLYNRVRTIDIKAMEIAAMVPDARVAVAHGQMEEGQLEDIMFAFINGEYDILVCTTIIESGLDMPNVNTIIVEDADKMGLAQLYQLRGRVGRSNRVAFAYVTYKKDKILAEIAEKRLQAIKEFTEFGSGFKIAMRDLEIRGAGNLLGQEQHGHMETVGYDMFCRLLDEAVHEINGEPMSTDTYDVSIDISIHAYIDDEYINTELQKIEMYKRIASIQDQQDVLDVEDELIDRYGDLPTPVKNLISVAFLKVLAKECGISGIQEKNETVLFLYREGQHLDIGILGKLMEKYKRRLMFTASNTPYITYKIQEKGKEELLSNIKILLQNIIELKNQP